MTVEAFVEGLSRSEKLIAMELIWRDLTIEPSTLESPTWHDKIVNERLANPMPGASLGRKEYQFRSTTFRSSWDRLPYVRFFVIPFI